MLLFSNATRSTFFYASIKHKNNQSILNSRPTYWKHMSLSKSSHLTFKKECLYEEVRCLQKEDGKWKNGDQNQRIRQQQWLWCYTALGGGKWKGFLNFWNCLKICAVMPRNHCSKKNTRRCYTIDALAAIFAIFTILYKTFTKLVQYFYNTFRILVTF